MRRNVSGDEDMLFSLVQVQNQSFEPKQNAKLTLDPPPTTRHHLPKTFCRVQGFFWAGLQKHVNFLTPDIAILNLPNAFLQ